VLQPAASEVQPLDAGSVHSADAGLHVRPVQGEVRQATSHAHDRPQLTVRHAPVPVQLMLHGPAPQVTFLQLCAPLHVIVHDLLLVQLMPLLHEPAGEHAMLQLQPVGQVTCCLHPPLSAQSIVQVFVVVLHDVHCAGQVAASPGGCASPLTPESTWDATQKPSVQVRPLLQSDCFVHAKSSLRWLIEQLPVVMTANPMTASQSATSFTASLQW